MSSKCWAAGSVVNHLHSALVGLSLHWRIAHRFAGRWVKSVWLLQDAELLESTKGDLAIIASDITTETKAVFPNYTALYYENPGAVSPSEFVRMSMSIPVFFEPKEVTPFISAPVSELSLCKHMPCSSAFNAMLSYCFFSRRALMCNSDERLRSCAASLQVGVPQSVTKSGIWENTKGVEYDGTFPDPEKEVCFRADKLPPQQRRQTDMHC